MTMIIWKNGDYTLEQDLYTKSYAIFKRVRYQSGTTAFFQQITPWYVKRKWCEKRFEKMHED